MNEKQLLTTTDLDFEEIAVGSGDVTERFDVELEKQKLDFAFYKHDTMRSNCTKRITAKDILIFEERPYLNADGADKFRGVFGIDELNRTTEIVYTDGSSKNIDDPTSMQGEFDYIRVSGIIKSNALNIQTPISGGKKVDLSMNPDKIWWIKTAQTNWSTRGIKKLLGLNSVNWNDLPNVKKEDCVSIKFVKRGGDKKIVNSEKASAVWEALLKINDGDVKSAEAMCIDLSSFTGKDGKVIAGRSVNELSEKQLDFMMSKKLEPMLNKSI